MMKNHHHGSVKINESRRQSHVVMHLPKNDIQSTLVLKNLLKGNVVVVHHPEHMFLAMMT